MRKIYIVLAAVVSLMAFMAPASAANTVDAHELASRCANKFDTTKTVVRVKVTGEGSYNVKAWYTGNGVGLISRAGSVDGSERLRFRIPAGSTIRVNVFEGKDQSKPVVLDTTKSALLC